MNATRHDRQELLDLRAIFERCEQGVAVALHLEPELADPKEARRMVGRALKDALPAVGEWYDAVIAVGPRDRTITTEQAAELAQLVYGEQTPSR